jgi:hypothetical protein
MSLTASPHELHDRLGRATAISTAARERAARAVAAAVDVTGRARHVCLESIGIRGQRDRLAGHEIPSDPSVRAFRIEGYVDGALAHARWSERGLECSPALLSRIEIVVALGETFDPGGGRPVVQASLDGPLRAVLPTVIRAFSKVTSIELAVGRCTLQTRAS